MGSSAGNVVNKLSRDAPSAKVFGIAQETVKLETGLSIKSSVMLRLNR